MISKATAKMVAM